MWTTTGPTAGQRVWTAVHCCKQRDREKWTTWTTCGPPPKPQVRAQIAKVDHFFAVHKVKPQVRRGGPPVPPYGGECPTDTLVHHPIVGGRP